ncbi:MAG TPA: hypothetical protein VKB12_17145 [Pyrinomonadaceae bacterium]|nr:hypothetical protein [Pyrinomonadaceae bacterium]
MSLKRELFSLRSVSRSLAAASILLSLHAVCLAQGPGVSVPRVDPAVERIRDEQQRQMALRSGGHRDKDAPPDERAVKAAAEQLNEDFKRVQVIRNELARAVTSGNALDYRHVSEEAAEVRKRSLRMQTYLALREEEGDAGKKQHEEEETDAAAQDEKSLRGSLVRLCHRIDSFVANPRFKSPEVFNVDASAKAARDLREIIALSRQIKGGAERLGRKDK